VPASVPSLCESCSAPLITARMGLHECTCMVKPYEQLHGTCVQSIHVGGLCAMQAAAVGNAGRGLLYCLA
jgi:hypothetical protein